MNGHVVKVIKPAEPVNQEPQNFPLCDAPVRQTNFGRGNKDDKRNRNILKYYYGKYGYSYNSLARMFNLTPQRIAQIVAKYSKEYGYERV